MRRSQVSGTQEALSKNSFRIPAWHSLETLPAFECIRTEEIGSDLGFVAPGADTVDSESSLSLWHAKSAFRKPWTFEKKNVKTITK